jgi:hypothetical protein
VFHNGYALDRDRLAESSTPDAEFIVAARNQLPRILDALDAVMAEHKVNIHDGWSYCFTCGAYGGIQGCPTVAAITKALEGKQ